MYTPYIQYPRQISPNPKWGKAIIWGAITSILAIIVIFANSCTTAKNAASKAAKIMDKYPEQVLPELRKKAPCVTIKYDTTYTTIDTVVNVDCPDSNSIEYFTIHDTIVKNKTNTVKVPVKIQLPSRTIYKYIEDSAKIKELTVKLRRITDEKEEAIKREKETNDKLSKARKTRNWLWVILVLLVAWKCRRQIVNLVNPLKGKV